MKELKLYVCETCGTQYSDIESAKDCEANHATPEKILDCIYLSKKRDPSGYPQKISVLFDDGESLEYRR